MRKSITHKKKMIYAIATLVGTIVGVGMFSLPYVASQVGFWPMVIYLIGGTIIAIAISLVYASVIIESNGKKRLPGYVNDYFGKKWGAITLINFLLGMYGSLIAYIIIGGNFLHGLVSPFLPISQFVSILIFFSLGSFLIYKGIESIAETEFFMLLFLVIIIIIFCFISFGKIKPANFSGYDMNKIFLPYGIVFFSLMGTSILPEIKEIFLKGEKKEHYSKKGKVEFKKAIIYSIIIALVIYIAFIFAVLGVSGANTSIEAFSGLKLLLSDKVVYLGYIFGFLSVFTSFISIGLTIKRCFSYDYNLKPIMSFILATLIPFALFLLGVNNFISIISLVGAITFGIAGCFIFALYFKIKKTGKLKETIITNYTGYALIIMFLVGIILSLKH